MNYETFKFHLNIEVELFVKNKHWKIDRNYEII